MEGIIEEDPQTRAWAASTRDHNSAKIGLEREYSILATIDSGRLKKVENLIDDVDGIGRNGTTSRINGTLNFVPPDAERYLKTKPRVVRGDKRARRTRLTN